MDFKFIFDLIRKLGPKLPLAWPYILHMVSDAKAIAAILAAPDAISVAARSGKKPAEISTANAEKFVKLCAAGGVSEKKARKALAA